MNGWWVVTLLLLVVIGQIVIYKRLKEQLQQSLAEAARRKRKLSETRQELAEVNARRKKLLSASTQALIIVEHDYRISSANKVARQLFGKFEKDTTLMTWTRQHQLQELVEQTLQGKKMPPFYLTWNERNLEAHARFIKENKTVVAVAVAIHDVTELQHLSRARRDFVTNISHELRTPLASLQLLTETLLNGALDDKSMSVKLVNKISGQVDTLGQLAREVLDLSMIESGKVPLRMASYSLQGIVQEQIDDLFPQAERKNITLQADIDDNVTVLVDETMLGRVLTNLIHNAIKFTKTGGVTLSVYKAKDDVHEGEWVTVRVSDTGRGILPDELPRIFERFYKIDQARNRAGTGLGLAIAKHIIEAHSGRIWVESDYGTGTTFYFTLPTEEVV